MVSGAFFLERPLLTLCALVRCVACVITQFVFERQRHRLTERIGTRLSGFNVVAGADLGD